MKKYGIVVVGCGYIGNQHLSDISYRENIQIIAVIDEKIEIAQLAAHKYGALHYGTNYQQYLLDNTVDIIIIATYASSHLAILQDCLSAKKHVLCEKPIATNLQDGKTFYEAVIASSSKVLIAHILRHNISYNKIHELIAAGEIGKLRVIRMVQNHHIMDWRRYKRLLDDCSPIVDCGVHYIDIMQWFAGASVTEVSGISTHIEDGTVHPNYGLVTAKMSTGVVGFYEAGWSKNISSRNLKEFIGDKGRISLELKQHRLLNREEGDLISIYHSQTGKYESINLPAVYKNMYGQLSTLIEMIEHDVQANPTIDEVYSAFCIAMTADRAICENQTLQIESQIF